MAEVYLLLGSNMGDRQRFLKEAARLLQEQAGRILERSSIYETEPWGFTSKDIFLNQVLLAETSLNPYELLKVIKAIETKLGRIGKNQRYIPRCIDIDILFYNDEVYFSDDLVIPHPRLHDRMFTLVPLNEIAPDYLHPILKKTIRELVNLCTDKLMVKKYLKNTATK
ncbi:MAG: 2-amino-4-hydroxy-6-hydroxymethyldihydropteridine diphosphokinase [Bacteroidetes bacterium]|nr:2-amino-4-hydroxy-6-hydroxymethyldihydropteridine diphosphokinase [Bacteroidota bacterium]